MHDAMPIDGPKIRFLYHLWDSLFGVIVEFTDLKISVKSLKSPGKVREFWQLPPVATLSIAWRLVQQTSKSHEM